MHYNISKGENYLYQIDQLVFEYKFVELDPLHSQYSEVLKKNDILRFELLSSIEDLNFNEFKSKLGLLSIFINGIRTNKELSYIFLYLVYLPTNADKMDLFEDTDTLRLDYNIEGSPVIDGDEVSFHYEEEDSPGVLSFDYKYNKETGILISYYYDYLDANQIIKIEHIVSTWESGSSDPPSTNTESGSFSLFSLIMGIFIINKIRKKSK